jgi:potassium-transporting ATPase potassium-binding subunit
MFNLLLGCISPGGVGTGLYSILLLDVLAAFLSGLMVGRTPQYMGKSIGTREMQLTVFTLLVSPVFMVGFAGASAVLKIALDSLGAGGPHGLSEILYAYASSVADNGSAFGGLNANTPWYNVTTGVAMFVGRSLTRSQF